MPWTNDPSGTGLSALPASGGTGWQVWSSSEVEGSAGDYSDGPPYYDSALNVYPHLASDDTSCFRMYAPAPIDMSATRDLLYSLSVGNAVDTGVISVKVGINYRNGEKGALFLKGNTLVAGLRCYYDNISLSEKTEGYNYSTAAWETITYTHLPGTVFTLKFWRTNAVGIGDYNIFHVYKNTDTTPIFSKTLLNTGTNNVSDIDRLRLYAKDVNTDPGAVNENTLCFNYLTGYSAYRF